MNSVASSHRPLLHHSSAPPYPTPPLDPDIRHLFASTFSLLDQPPPPSLREILSAYNRKGDGDREMLLSMLNAKAAEDQRIASIAALHRTTLEVYHSTRQDGSPLHAINGQPCAMPHSPSAHQYEQKRSQRPHSPHRSVSRSRSPSRSYLHISPTRDAPKSDTAAEYPRKRPRMSQSSPSHSKVNDSYAASQHDHLPPSPYSSSQSDSAECSPRSRLSMAIGSLLSSGPQRTVTVTDTLGQE